MLGCSEKAMQNPLCNIKSRKETVYWVWNSQQVLADRGQLTYDPPVLITHNSFTSFVISIAYQRNNVQYNRTCILVTLMVPENLNVAKCIHMHIHNKGEASAAQKRLQNQKPCQVYPCTDRNYREVTRIKPCLCWNKP